VRKEPAVQGSTLSDRPPKNMTKPKSKNGKKDKMADLKSELDLVGDAIAYRYMCSYFNDAQIDICYCL